MMWRIFNRNRKLKPADAARLEQLEFDFGDLAHKHAVLAERFQKLAGRYYKRFGTGEGDTQPSRQMSLPVGSSKDDLRRLAGIRAGRPAPHTEDN